MSTITFESINFKRESKTKLTCKSLYIVENSIKGVKRGSSLKSFMIYSLFFILWNKNKKDILNVFILQNYQYININIKNINIRISVRAKTTLIGPNDFHCLDKKNYLFQNNFYVPQKKVIRISNETMVSK